jgi:RND family efflux transporter MFP subunit
MAAVPLFAALGGCGSHGGAAAPDDEHAKKDDEHAKKDDEHAKKDDEHAKKDEPQEAHVKVRTEAARIGTFTETVDCLGRCEALPDHIATLTPAVEGHVHALIVMQGDAVKKGQPIVELDKVVAQADVAEKTATRDGLKASLTLLKSLPRPEERRANELAVDQAKVAVERARALLESLESLKGNNLTSKQQLFDAEKAVEAAVFQQRSAEATLHAMMIGPRPEAVAEAEGKIKTADALVDLSRAHLEFHTIRAPIDGVLDSLKCRLGQTIAIGSPIGEVVDTTQVFASVWLPPRSAASVRVSQPAQIRFAESHGTAPAPAPADQKVMAGKVAFVGRVADLQTGNLPVRILVDNPQGQLTIGQSIRAAIGGEEHKGVLQVPAVAILDLGEGPVLGVVRDGKAVQLHPEVGAPRDGWVVVSGTDLKEGEPVIVEGGYNLPEDTPVLVSERKAPAGAEAAP